MVAINDARLHKVSQHMFLLFNIAISDFFVNNFIYSLKIDIHIYLYKVLVLGNRTRNRYFEEYSYSESVLGLNFGIVPSLIFFLLVTLSMRMEERN